MLEYDKIDVSEGIDVKKTNCFRKCIFCHYWYFFEIHFKGTLESTCRFENLPISSSSYKNNMLKVSH